MELNLQHFTGYNLTIATTTGVASATAAKSTGLAKDEETVLTITYSSGYEDAGVEIVSGGGSYNPTTKKYKSGDADGIIQVKAKKNNIYKITENVTVNVNGSKTELTKNMTLERGANGAIVGVTCEGTEVTVSADVIGYLLAQGVLIKL